MMRLMSLVATLWVIFLLSYGGNVMAVSVDPASVESEPIVEMTSTQPGLAMLLVFHCMPGLLPKPMSVLSWNDCAAISPDR